MTDKKKFSSAIINTVVHGEELERIDECAELINYFTGNTFFKLNDDNIEVAIKIARAFFDFGDYAQENFVSPLEHDLKVQFETLMTHSLKRKELYLPYNTIHNVSVESAITDAIFNANDYYLDTGIIAIFEFIYNNIVINVDRSSVFHLIDRDYNRVLSGANNGTVGPKCDKKLSKDEL